jgi:hypothetical protein
MAIKGLTGKGNNPFPLSFQQATAYFALKEQEKYISPRRKMLLDSFIKECFINCNTLGVIPNKISGNHLRFRADEGFFTDIIIPRRAPEIRYETFCNLWQHWHVYFDYAFCIKFDKGPFHSAVCSHKPCETCRRVCNRSLLQFLAEILEVIREPDCDITPAKSIHFHDWGRVL